MMLYAVIDKKAKQIVTIFPSLNDKAAERSFIQLLSGPQNIFTDFPEDFALLCLADVQVNGLTVTVQKPGNEVLTANGFKADIFTVCDYIVDGSELSKPYLAQLRSDRMNYGAIVPGTESKEVNDE